jgi:hypothetical protein
MGSIPLAPEQLAIRIGRVPRSVGAGDIVMISGAG